MSGLRFDLAFPIQKVDAERRIVGGWATTEALDRQGDIIPFDVARQAFARFAERSGAVREMHQPKAVGRLESWRPDPERRGVWAEVYLSRSRDGEDVLTKVREGVLKGFSIGGVASSWDYQKAEDGRTARVLRDVEIYELSLVDVPANPEARIAVVKVADPVSGEAVEPVSPGEPDPIEVPDPLSGNPPTQPDPSRRLRSDPAGNTNGLASPFAPGQSLAKAEKDGEREKLRQAQRERARRYRIAPKPSGHLTPPKGYPEDPDQYGDPVNYAYPVDRQRWRAAIAYFNQTEHKRQGGYTDREWAIIGRRIAELASRVSGNQYVYDPKDQKVKAKEEKLMSEAISEAIAKRDVTLLVESLRGLIQSALSAVDEGDAEAVRDRLSQAAAALDVAVDEVSDLEESAESVESGMVSSPSTASTPSSPTKASTRTKAESVSTASAPTTAHDSPSPTVSVPTGSRTGTPSTPSESVSKAELRDAIREVLSELLGARPQPPAQAPVPRPAESGLTPVQKALMEGDLVRAVQEAGSEAAVYEAAHNGAQQILKQLFRTYLPAMAVVDPWSGGSQ